MGKRLSKLFKTVDGQRNLPKWFKTAALLLDSISIGSLIIELPDKRQFLFSSENPGPEGVLLVRHKDFFTRLLREGENGFSESYMDEWWDTPDLLMLLDFMLANKIVVEGTLPGARLVRFYENFVHWLRSNTKRQAKKNISAHYDLGNKFYENWLDKTMTYSSALFDKKTKSLEDAQRNKYSRICETLKLKPGDKVLEIGCGWGGFMEHAIKNNDVFVKGLTISKKQLNYASNRMNIAGLYENGEVALQDYRDEKGLYDAIVSIEMFEAVGEKYWPDYFKTLSNSLKSGARATLQIITISEEFFPEYRKSVDFIQKYIFPGGMLPSDSALKGAFEAVGLKKVDQKEFGKSYSKTLRIWHNNFNAVWSDISSQGFDERFKRMWNFYLASCAAFFESETGNVVQLTLQKD